MGGGLFSSPQQQMIPPTPVEKVPGLQNLGQQLVQYFQNILSGQSRQMPYAGAQSVYGGPGGSFPGLYSNQPQTQGTQNQGFGADLVAQLSNPNSAIAQAIKNLTSPSTSTNMPTDVVRGGDQGLR